MIFTIQDQEYLKQYIQQSTTQKLLDNYLIQNAKELENHQEQNNIFLKYNDLQQEFQREIPIEMRELEIKKESLERRNADLCDELREIKIVQQEQKDIIEAQSQQISLLESQLNSIKSENNNLQMAAECQAKDIKELHISRDQLMKELEKLTIEKNQLQDIMLQEKIKISEQLNELNELNDSLMRQRKALEDDQQRFNKQYKDLQNTGKFVQLAPQASEAQLARNAFNDDVPQMVVRRLNKYHAMEIYDMAQNLNGSIIATCGGDRIVRLYDTLNLNVISQMQISSDEVFTTIQFSPQQDSILVGSTNDCCQIYGIQGWKLKNRMVGHGDQVTCVGYLGGDKDSCVSGSKDRSIKQWNIHNSYCTRTISTGSQVTSMVSQHNVPIVVSGHRDGSIRGYSMKSDQKPIFQEKCLFDDSVTSLCISSDNNQILCCSKEGYYIKNYELRMNKVVKTYENDRYMNSYDHNKICFGPDEKYLIAGNSDGTLVSWATEGKFYKTLNKGCHEGVVLCVSYHPVSGQMYSADTRGNFVIWK